MTTPLFHSVRFASGNVDYPLPVAGPAHWHPGSEPIRVALPDVPADHVIAASFSSRPAPTAFSFRLAFGRRRAETARFGARARRREYVAETGAAEAGVAEKEVSVPVDYFHAGAALASPVLSLRHAPPAPQDYLISVSIRPRLITPPTHMPADTAIAGAARLSQTTLDAADRRRACSPTATAMALGIADHDNLRAFVHLARHRATGLLGVWPQNIWAAARHGRLGAVELMSDWDTVRRALASGGDHAAPLPLVASVAFDRGALPGSPLPKSGGHLVTVRGIEQGAVVVHDPAAAPARVLRRYDAVRFAAVWMRWRGAAYVFARDPGGAPSAVESGVDACR